MNHNSAIVSESSGKLNTTVNVFKTMIESSEAVIGIIGELNQELQNISDLKEDMLSSMGTVQKSIDNLSKILNTSEAI